MGQCCTKKETNTGRPHKQNKNIDDKRMFKVGVDILNKDFCIQIGYNCRAVKNYSEAGRLGGDVQAYSNEEPVQATNMEHKIS